MSDWWYRLSRAAVCSRVGWSVRAVNRWTRPSPGLGHRTCPGACAVCILNTPPGGGWSCCGPTSSRARVVKFSEPPLRTRAYATAHQAARGGSHGTFSQVSAECVLASHTGCSRATRNQPCEGCASPSSWRASPPGSAAVGATSRRLRRSCPQRRWSYRPLPEERTAPRWWRSHQLRSPWVLTRSRRPCPWRPLQSSWTPAMPCQCPCQSLVVQTQCPCQCQCQNQWRCLWRSLWRCL